ncbi:MAG: SemiSWEET transporter [Spirochaetota bacterium]
MDNCELIGIIAGIATTGSFIPQAYKVYKTKRTADLSATTYFVLIVGLCLWTTYGIKIQAISIILANAVTLLLSIYILIMKIKHG